MKIIFYLSLFSILFGCRERAMEKTSSAAVMRQEPINESLENAFNYNNGIFSSSWKKLDYTYSRSDPPWFTAEIEASELTAEILERGSVSVYIKQSRPYAVHPLPYLTTIQRPNLRPRTEYFTFSLSEGEINFSGTSGSPGDSVRYVIIPGGYPYPNPVDDPGFEHEY